MLKENTGKLVLISAKLLFEGPVFHWYPYLRREQWPVWKRKKNKKKKQLKPFILMVKILNGGPEKHELTNDFLVYLPFPFFSPHRHTSEGIPWTLSTLQTAKSNTLSIFWLHYKHQSMFKEHQGHTARLKQPLLVLCDEASPWRSNCLLETRPVWSRDGTLMCKT